MRVKDVLEHKFSDDNYIKDYRKTMKILDEKTKETIEVIRKK